MKGHCSKIVKLYKADKPKPITISSNNRMVLGYMGEKLGEMINKYDRQLNRL